MVHEGHQERVDPLPAEATHFHRALVSLIGEPAAAVRYDRRADACTGPGATAVPAHNRDGEIEHAAMTLAWIRRIPVFDSELRDALLEAGPISGRH